MNFSSICIAMWTTICLFLFHIILCQGSDAPCHQHGGTCQENSHACAGGYQSNLCSGGATRQCCLPASTSNACSGTCQDDSLKCGGSYISNACSGGANIRCCLATAQEIDTGDCPNVKIISRDSWGARRPHSISHLTSPVQTFFIHHTESPSCHDFHTCVLRMKSFQNFHMDSRGWSDIGYSFLVGEDGNVYEGRGWTRTGAHTRCYNSVALAASMIGSFMDHVPNRAAQDAVKALIQCGVTKNYISSDYSLHGHRDVNPTNCPGDVWYSELHNVWPNHFHKRSTTFCNK